MTDEPNDDPPQGGGQSVADSVGGERTPASS